MDELVCPGSSSSSPSHASFSGAVGHHQDLEFVSCDVLQEWLGDDDWLGEPPPPAPKRRGRKPAGAHSTGPALTHVEAERQRRDKLNRRFCELRAAVPTVSRMDKASLLADAAAYIAELRDRVKKLEAETKPAAATSSSAAAHSVVGVHQEETLEVRMLAGRDAAALRLTTAAARQRHAAERFMVALRSLDLPVQHACVCVVGGVTVQDAVVDVPAAALRDERVLRAALVHSLQQQTG